MLKSKILANAVRVALISGAATAVFTVPAVSAAEGGEKIERIEVTGSSIKRTDIEGALPVTVISKEDIVRSGAVDTAELIQQLPSMQGFTVSADSVGGGGGGYQTASIHDLGASYTLVLINGRRLAPSTSGSTIDLNSIPLAAIERVEVLTDGASALYGSDAIAGVVNFILKENYQGVQLQGRYDKPQESGGESWNGSITAGLGDFETDGYNIMIAYTHDDQSQLASKDRDFAKTGMIPFNVNGQDYFFFNGSGNAIPGNARTRDNTLAYRDAKGNIVSGPLYPDHKMTKGNWSSFNPYLAANGQCAESNSPIGKECFFDYTSTIEILPENSRDSVFVNADIALTDDISVFAEGIYAKHKMTTRIAPYPTGFFPIPVDSALTDKYVVPYLSPEQKAFYDAGTLDVNARWRALPAGNRTTEFDTTAIHFVAGVDGVVGNMDFEAAVTYSSNDQDQNYPTGWLLSDPFLDAVSSGAIDVFVPADQLDDASKAALAKTVYSGNWSGNKIDTWGLDFKGSLPVFEMPAGDAYLGFGGDYRKTSFKQTISDANKNEEILFLSTDDAYDLERDTYGVFAEFVLPVIDNMDITASLRYDSIGGVDDKKAGGKVNGSESDLTYKLSARYQVTDSLLLRASYGTGFKAPSMLEIARPRAEFGVTGDNYECPFPGSDPLAQYCLPGRSQYSVFVQGYPELKPEKSTQYSGGFVFAPTQDFSVTLDYWNVEMKDQVTSLTEAQIFAQADTYRDLFTTKRNLATGEDELAIIQASVNVGKSKNSGIDWNMTLNNDFGWGELSSYFVGTYMIQSEYTKPGTNEYISSMGRFGDNNSVTFRVISHVGTTLTVGDSQTSLIAKYRSGYQDQFQSADLCSVTFDDALGDCADIQLHVPSYTTVDFQTRYFFTDNFNATFGIANMFNREPSLSLRGGGSGHQVGYDPRYTDSLGRTFYLQADYKF
ncbi:TonB-dependent receptor [Shewanella sp. GXUN23E]|uniref:TonB-dependent receptor n=1 Tax=Shewanella sp. GXUN23E TaxID=3422498 RepID=UPI003D7DD182